MESPFAPKNKIEIGKEYSYAYKILDSNKIITNDIRSEIIYPDEAREFIEIINVNVTRDEYSEDQIKEEFKDSVDEKKLENIAVYEVLCTYIIKKRGNIVFQPEIKLFFDQKEQSLAPFEQFVFLILMNNQNKIKLEKINMSFIKKFSIILISLTLFSGCEGKNSDSPNNKTLNDEEYNLTITNNSPLFLKSVVVTVDEKTTHTLILKLIVILMLVKSQSSGSRMGIIISRSHSIRKRTTP